MSQTSELKTGKCLLCGTNGFFDNFIQNLIIAFYMAFSMFCINARAYVKHKKSRENLGTCDCCIYLPICLFMDFRYYCCELQSWQLKPNGKYERDHRNQKQGFHKMISEQYSWNDHKCEYLCKEVLFFPAFFIKLGLMYIMFGWFSSRQQNQCNAFADSENWKLEHYFLEMKVSRGVLPNR